MRRHCRWNSPQCSWMRILVIKPDSTQISMKSSCYNPEKVVKSPCVAGFPAPWLRTSNSDDRNMAIRTAKAKLKSNLRAGCQSIGGTICAGAVLVLAHSGQAQNLFVGNASNGNIDEITPAGGQSTFVSGLTPFGIAFDSAGDLFEADNGSGDINEFTPAGTESTYGSVTFPPLALAFQGETLPVPEPPTSALAALSGLSLMLIRCRRK